jgi:single-stranded DNA-specific DHH superfamily exonuclease
VDASSVDACRTLAERLDELNTRRREQERKATKAACETIDAEPVGTERPCHVVWSEDWHRGVIGIVASRLAERFRRPAIVITVEGDQAYGSGRSIPGFDLLGALDHCESLLTQYGGHRQAAGIRLKSARLQEFRRRLADVARSPLQATCSLRIPGFAALALYVFRFSTGFPPLVGVHHTVSTDFHNDLAPPANQTPEYSDPIHRLGLLRP